jgi:hypothetical protein
MVALEFIGLMQQTCGFIHFVIPVVAEKINEFHIKYSISSNSTTINYIK